MGSQALISDLVSKLLIANNLALWAKFSNNEKLMHYLSYAGLSYYLVKVSNLYLSRIQICPEVIIKLPPLP
jgi:hypothetical protein